MRKGKIKMFNIPKGPFCQSCGIPMENAEYGTNNDGSKNDVYCSYCFQNGEFTAPDITMEQMIDKVSGIMTEKLSLPGFQAKMMAGMFIPKLNRWQNK